NLSASAMSSLQMNLSWTASTDNVGVAGYTIYRGGSQIATTSLTSYSDTGLSPSTAYAYTVAAYDAAGHVSVQAVPAAPAPLAFTAPAHACRAYVRSTSNAEQLLASNLSFRTEQAAASALNTLGLYASVGSETACNLAVTCVTSAGSWQNVAFAAQSGAFAAE